MSLLVLWTVVVWGGRVRNVNADPALEGWGYWSPMLLSASFLVLAVAVTIIEVVLIATIMLGENAVPTLARDTVFAVVMIATVAHKATDVFYLTHQGAKLLPHVEEELKVKLLAACGG